MWAGQFSGIGGNDLTGRGGALMTETLNLNMKLPRKATAAPKAFSRIDPYTNESIDLHAPGVRELIPMPTPFAQPVLRNNLFDGYNAAPFDYEQFGDWVGTRVAREQAQYWWQLLNNGYESFDCPRFWNKATYNVAPTGFTALRNIVPHGTVVPVTPFLH